MHKLAIIGLLDFVKQEKLEEAKKFVKVAEDEVALLNTRISELSKSERESLELIKEIIKNVLDNSIKPAARALDSERLRHGYKGLIDELERLKDEQMARRDTESKQQHANNPQNQPVQTGPSKTQEGVTGVPGGVKSQQGGAQYALGGATTLEGGAKCAQGGATILLAGATGVPGGATSLQRGAPCETGGAKTVPGGATGAPGRNTGAPGGATTAPGGDTSAQRGDMGAQRGDSGTQRGDTGAQRDDTGAQRGDTGAQSGDTGAQRGATGATGVATTAPGGTTTAPGGATSSSTRQSGNARHVPTNRPEDEPKTPTCPQFGRKGENKKDLVESASENQKSKRSSQAMQVNNPDIADLSDTNRPTKLAERFSELYDNEWTEAFDYLHNKMNLDERMVVGHLLTIVQDAYGFCQREADLQITDMESAALDIIIAGRRQANTSARRETGENKTMKDLLKEFRKQHAHLAIQRLQQAFLDEKVKKKDMENSGMANFARKAVEVTWWMNVQNPPVYMCPTDMTMFDANMYRAYTKTGQQPKYFVWPALKLYEKGGILARGVVQFE